MNLLIWVGRFGDLVYCQMPIYQAKKSFRYTYQIFFFNDHTIFNILYIHIFIFQLSYWRRCVRVRTPWVLPLYDSGKKKHFIRFDGIKKKCQMLISYKIFFFGYCFSIHEFHVHTICPWSLGPFNIIIY